MDFRSRPHQFWLPVGLSHDPRDYKKKLTLVRVSNIIFGPVVSKLVTLDDLFLPIFTDVKLMIVP